MVSILGFYPELSSIFRFLPAAQWLGLVELFVVLVVLGKTIVLENSLPKVISPINSCACCSWEDHCKNRGI